MNLQNCLFVAFALAAVAANAEDFRVAGERARRERAVEQGRAGRNRARRAGAHRDAVARGPAERAPRGDGGLRLAARAGRLGAHVRLPHLFALSAQNGFDILARM